MFFSYQQNEKITYIFFQSVGNVSVHRRVNFTENPKRFYPQILKIIKNQLVFLYFLCWCRKKKSMIFSNCRVAIWYILSVLVVFHFWLVFCVGMPFESLSKCGENRQKKYRIPSHGASQKLSIHAFCSKFNFTEFTFAS